MYDLSKFNEAFEKASELLPHDELYQDGVIVRGEDITVYMSHEGYREFKKEVYRELKKSIQKPK